MKLKQWVEHKKKQVDAFYKEVMEEGIFDPEDDTEDWDGIFNESVMD